MTAIAYRSDMDMTTGAVITGWPCVVQSLDLIWRTPLDSLLMALAFGSELRSWLAEDVTTTTALGVYDALIAAAEANEPEYRVTELQLVRLTRTGGLGLRHAGLYYPEGRLGNYTIAHSVGASLALTAAAVASRGRTLQ
jgi:phage baseplate assembly protein W